MNIKKILTTCLALTIVFSFTGCSLSINMNKKTTSAAETTTAPEVTTEPEVTDEPDVTTEEETPTKEDSDLYVGSGYTLNIDQTKWESNSSYSDDNIDCLYINSNYPTANFNVISEASDFTEDMDYSLLDTQFEKQYNDMDGYTYIDSETVEINGYKVFKAYISIDKGDITQYLFFHDGKEVIITYSKSTDTSTDADLDFEDVLNSFEFAD